MIFRSSPLPPGIVFFRVIVPFCCAGAGCGPEIRSGVLTTETAEVPTGIDCFRRAFIGGCRQSQDQSFVFLFAEEEGTHVHACCCLCCAMVARGGTVLHGGFNDGEYEKLIPIQQFCPCNSRNRNFLQTCLFTPLSRSKGNFWPSRDTHERRDLYTNGGRGMMVEKGALTVGKRRINILCLSSSWRYRRRHGKRSNTRPPPPPPFCMLEETLRIIRGEMYKNCKWVTCLKCQMLSLLCLSLLNLKKTFNIFRKEKTRRIIGSHYRNKFQNTAWWICPCLSLGAYHDYIGIAFPHRLINQEGGE